MTDPIVLYSSRRGIASAALSPAVLLALATGAGVTRSVTTSVLVIGAVGLLLGLVVAWDYPLRSEFAIDGITRVCPLRHQHLPWERVVALERTPGRAKIRRQRDSGIEGFRAPAGLAARVGNRRYMLTDRSEGALEYDQLVLAMKVFDEAVLVRASRPALTTAPTSFSRRRIHPEP